MMVVSNDPICEENKIYRPKPKKVYKSHLKLSPITHVDKKMHKKKKKKENLGLDLNLKNAKSQNFDLISFEEIENDFKELKDRSERDNIEKELLALLENSTKDTSFNEEKSNKRIKRPKNNFYQNFESINM